MPVKKKSWPLPLSELKRSPVHRARLEAVADNKLKPRRGWKQFPPPFKKLTEAGIRRLGDKFEVHPNPDPGDCPYCGLPYKNMKTGLTFQMVKDMLWIADEDPDRWRHKGRHSVLGLWFEIKRSMWDDHIYAHEHPEEVEEYLDAFDGDYAGPSDPTPYETSLSSDEPPF